MFCITIIIFKVNVILASIDAFLNVRIKYVFFIKIIIKFVSENIKYKYGDLFSFFYFYIPNKAMDVLVFLILIACAVFNIM